MSEEKSEPTESSLADQQVAAKIEALKINNTPDQHHRSLIEEMKEGTLADQQNAAEIEEVIKNSSNERVKSEVELPYYRTPEEREIDELPAPFELIPGMAIVHEGLDLAHGETLSGMPLDKSEQALVVAKEIAFEALPEVVGRGASLLLRHNSEVAEEVAEKIIRKTTENEITEQAVSESLQASQEAAVKAVNEATPSEFSSLKIDETSVPKDPTNALPQNTAESESIFETLSAKTNARSEVNSIVIDSAPAAAAQPTAVQLDTLPVIPGASEQSVHISSEPVSEQMTQHKAQSEVDSIPVGQPKNGNNVASSSAVEPAPPSTTEPSQTDFSSMAWTEKDNNSAFAKRLDYQLSPAPKAPDNTNFDSAHASGAKNFRNENSMPEGTQAHHWTKKSESENAQLHPDRMNENMSALQSLKDKPAVTLLTDPNGGGTTYSTDGEFRKPGTDFERIESGTVYQTEHKFADNYLIPEIAVRNESELDPGNVALWSGAEARWKMTGGPGQGDWGPQPDTQPPAAPSNASSKENVPPSITSPSQEDGSSKPSPSVPNNQPQGTILSPTGDAYQLTSNLSEEATLEADTASYKENAATSSVTDITQTESNTSLTTALATATPAEVEADTPSATDTTSTSSPTSVESVPSPVTDQVEVEANPSPTADLVKSDLSPTADPVGSDLSPAADSASASSSVSESSNTDSGFGDY